MLMVCWLLMTRSFQPPVGTYSIPNKPGAVQGAGDPGEGMTEASGDDCLQCLEGTEL
ncbi:hypothetical protein GSbR_21180 [Geobacter sp. SVR]|nr:hypothetical protein GSVR_16640 [Geobacter sp. SVR]GCF85518.1 hypothetical protein GSbR_21180 [Geobacter sp. SVR]